METRSYGFFPLLSRSEGLPRPPQERSLLLEHRVSLRTRKMQIGNKTYIFWPNNFG